MARVYYRTQAAMTRFFELHVALTDISNLSEMSLRLTTRAALAFPVCDLHSIAHISLLSVFRLAVCGTF